jgi:hypothetical protein
VSGQLHTPAALPLGKEPRYPLDRKFGGPQSRCERHGKVKIFEPIGTRTSTPRSSSQQLVAIPTELSRLVFLKCYCIKGYCDMTSESQNSPLLDNSSLTHVPWRCGFVETDLVRDALSMSTESTNSFHGYTQATNSFHGYTQATNSFHGYTLHYSIRSRAEKNDSLAREFRGQFNSGVLSCEVLTSYDSLPSND